LHYAPIVRILLPVPQQEPDAMPVPPLSQLSAVGYIRVSTEEQAREGVSLAAQEAKLRAYCELQGLQLMRIYRDEGISAGKPLVERPQGENMLEALKDGEAGHVVTLKLDRLFRDAVDCLQRSREWDATGVAMHLIDMGGQTVNTASATGRFMLTVMAGAAEMERNLIRERTRAAMQYKKERGDRLGASPLGFSTAEPGATLMPVERELEPVRFILQRRAAGESYNLIADQLRELGLPTKRGGRWYPATVRNVWLRRKRYASALS